MEALLKLHNPELTQDDLNRMQMEIAYINAGQIKYASRVLAAAWLIGWFVRTAVYVHFGI